MPAHFSRPKRPKMSLLAQVNEPKEWLRKYRERLSTGSENQLVNPSNVVVQPIEQQQNDQAGEAIGETVAFHSGAVLNDQQGLASFMRNFDPQPQSSSRALINMDAVIRENGSLDLPSNPPIGSIGDDSTGNYRMDGSDGNGGNVVANVQNPQEDPMQNDIGNGVQQFRQNPANQQQQEPSSVVTDNSVRSQNPNRKRPNRRSLTLKMQKRANKKRRSRKRSQKRIAKRPPFPCKRGTRHAVHEIVYQALDAEGDLHFLMNWNVPKWKEGPTFVKIKDVDRYSAYYHKHYRNKAMYDEWLKQVEGRSGRSKIKALLKLAKGIVKRTADEARVIDGFKRRFRIRKYSLRKLSVEMRLWHTWHLYSFERFVETRGVGKKKPNRPHGDSWSYGHLHYQRICRHVGENEDIYQFANHVPEV